MQRWQQPWSIRSDREVAAESRYVRCVAALVGAQSKALVPLQWMQALAKLWELEIFEKLAELGSRKEWVSEGVAVAIGRRGQMEINWW